MVTHLFPTVTLFIPANFFLLCLDLFFDGSALRWNTLSFNVFLETIQYCASKSDVVLRGGTLKKGKLAAQWNFKLGINHEFWCCENSQNVLPKIILFMRNIGLNLDTFYLMVRTSKTFLEIPVVKTMQKTMFQWKLHKIDSWLKNIVHVLSLTPKQTF